MPCYPLHGRVIPHSSAMAAVAPPSSLPVELVEWAVGGHEETEQSTAARSKQTTFARERSSRVSGLLFLVWLFLLFCLRIVADNLIVLV